jgi:flagellin
LSSGLRINKASDDAAGLAIAQNLKTDTRVFAQGIRNINDGISILNIAQGALTELTQVTLRQLELATQGANGVLSTKQREAIETEANALVNEYNRIVASTSFNGTNILSGSYRDGLRVQAGYGLDGSISAALGNLLARNIGTGTFSSSQNLVAVRSGTDIVYDINGDGKDDILKWNSGMIDTYMSNGDGTFSYKANSANSFAAPTYIFDLDGDGIKDAITNQTIADGIYFSKGNADGTFAYSTTINAGAGAVGDIGNNHRIKFGDFDGNGKIDLLHFEYNVTNAKIIYQNANGTFTASTTVAIDGNMFEAEVGDFNQDGRADFIIGMAGSGTRLFTSNGNGTFAVRSAFQPESRDITVSDFNGDGILDFVAGHTYFESISRVFIGNGNGTFRVSATITDGVGTYGTNFVADYNNDGHQDILFTESTGTRIVYGNGDGTFSNGSLLSPTNVVVGDFNGDGVTDINDWASGTSVIRNQDATKSGGITRIELSTAEYARQELATIQSTAQRISSEVGSIGSLMSRFDVARKNLEVTKENYLSAHSRITDIDVAEEAASLILASIRKQAAASILTHANLDPQIVLKLLS